MIDHFGIRLRKSEIELRLTRDNYAAVTNNKSSFFPNEIHSEVRCKEFYDDGMINFDININNFSLLNKKEFNFLVHLYMEEHQFTEIFDLNLYSGKSGYYILVLDEYCQVYIGQTSDFKKRIMSHWNKSMPLDRLIFRGGVKESVLSIDSFKALDTTRIFVFTTTDIVHENRFIMEFPLQYRLNRVPGNR